ncbi:MAG: hypothetical protein EXQ69_08145 [Acidimicrobiia bacterium]|nr:hypothetical protein [Acidimicrobiia bacterium]
MASDVMPMFPLGNVLVPGQVMQLHIFEERYRILVTECLAVSSEFGVVLIERGSEVGGGDARFDIGTVARIVEASQYDDGRYQLVVVGAGRVRVDEWLEDAPYPRASVTRVLERESFPRDGEKRDALERTFQDLILLAGRFEGAPEELPADPVEACWRAIELSPVNPMDALAVLRVEDVSERLDLANSLMKDLCELLAMRNRE